MTDLREGGFDRLGRQVYSMLHSNGFDAREIYRNPWCSPQKKTTVFPVDVPKNQIWETPVTLPFHTATAPMALKRFEHAVSAENILQPLVSQSSGPFSVCGVDDGNLLLSLCMGTIQWCPKVSTLSTSQVGCMTGLGSLCQIT